jgi:type IV pilus assembly protein PilB
VAARKKIGAILRDEGRITDADVQRVLDYQRTQGGLFGQALVSLGLVSPEEVEKALATQLGLPGARPRRPDAKGGAGTGQDETK